MNSFNLLQNDSHWANVKKTKPNQKHPKSHGSKAQILQHTENLQSFNSPEMSVLCWGDRRKREESFLCNTASTFSHFRFPPMNSIWWAFPPLVKSMFQHLAGVFRERQSIWAVLLAGSSGKAAGRALHAILLWRKQHIPAHPPGTNYRQFLG